MGTSGFLFISLVSVGVVHSEFSRQAATGGLGVDDDDDLCLLQRHSSFLAEATTADLSHRTVGSEMFLIVACVVSGILAVLATTAAAVWAYRSVDSHSEEVEVRTDEALDSHTCTFAIALLVRRHETGEKNDLRHSGLTLAFVLLFVTFAMQLYAVVCIKMYVTPSQVHDMRMSYDRFEWVMYGSDQTHMTMTSNGEHRGIAKYFQPELFETLGEEEIASICNIPFSEIFFFALVLFIWGLTCFSKLKSCTESFFSLICNTPTIDSMTEALATVEDDDTPRQLIVGLTKSLKVLLSVLIFLPWMSITMVILHLGCRWLASTEDYGDLILNAVALEFVLQLNVLLYQSVAPQKSRETLENTRVAPPWRRERAGFFVFFSGAWPALLSLLWVYLYIHHIQSVLPEYQWDVHPVCSRYLTTLLSSEGG